MGKRLSGRGRTYSTHPISFCSSRWHCPWFQTWLGAQRLDLGKAGQVGMTQATEARLGLGAGTSSRLTLTVKILSAETDEAMT